MAILLQAYPKLDRELLTKTGYMSAEYDFFYKRNGEDQKLKATTTDSSTSKTAVLQLTDPCAQWHPEKNGLWACITCIINVPAFLFGEKGIASADGGILGIAVMWMAPDSSERGVVIIDEISKYSMAPYTIRGNIKFQEKMLRGTLILRTVLYLKERGNPTGMEKYQASEPGTIFGVLDETRVIIDGNGSMFPIHETAAPTNPLWWVQCKWSEAVEDKFSDDNFCIYLNTAHKDYSSLNANEGLKNSPLLLEIICSALEILVTKVMKDPVASQAVMTGEGLTAGSIASVVNFFINKFGWRFDEDSPEQLSMDIRKSMMNVML